MMDIYILYYLLWNYMLHLEPKLEFELKLYLIFSRLGKESEYWVSSVFERLKTCFCCLTQEDCIWFEPWLYGMKAYTNVFVMEFNCYFWVVIIGSLMDFEPSSIVKHVLFLGWKVLNPTYRFRTWAIYLWWWSIKFVQEWV